MHGYFFSGNEYIRVTLGDAGPGVNPIDPGYPASILDWGWGSFGANGIDAALWGKSSLFVFSGVQFIRVSHRLPRAPLTDLARIAAPNASPPEPALPAPIADWGWGYFGAAGIDAAFQYGSKSYIFAGDQYLRMNPTGIDRGYPRSISAWGWDDFGSDGIDGALCTNAAIYCFAGTQYIRVSASDSGGWQIDPGYPAPLSDWGWRSFAANGIQAVLAHAPSKSELFPPDGNPGDPGDGGNN